MTYRMANALTFLRILLIPFFMVALAYGFNLIAFGLFALAAITDFLDGWIARKFNQTSVMGEIMDPIADKLLTLAALLMLIFTGLLSGLDVAAAFLILAREIIVSGLRDYLSRSNASLPVSFLAKIKTTAQFIALSILIVGEAGTSYLAQWVTIGRISLWFAVLLTLWTGWEYWRATLRQVKQ